MARTRSYAWGWHPDDGLGATWGEGWPEFRRAQQQERREAARPVRSHLDDADWALRAGDWRAALAGIDRAGEVLVAAGGTTTIQWYDADPEALHRTAPPHERVLEARGALEDARAQAGRGNVHAALGALHDAVTSLMVGHDEAEEAAVDVAQAEWLRSLVVEAERHADERGPAAKPALRSMRPDVNTATSDRTDEPFLELRRRFDRAAAVVFDRP